MKEKKLYEVKTSGNTFSYIIYVVGKNEADVEKKVKEKFKYHRIDRIHFFQTIYQ